MPKQWSETVGAHRAAVRDATLDTAAALVAAHGLRSLTMSRIAEETGVARATLYKYFPDTNAILAAWHERQIARHLQQLGHAGQGARTARDKLEAVLSSFALMTRESGRHDDMELVAFLHRDERVSRGHQQVMDMVGSLLEEAVTAGDVRDDVPSPELASYCLHSLQAARLLPSEAAVRRLVAMTLSGLRPPT